MNTKQISGVNNDKPYSLTLIGESRPECIGVNRNGIKFIVDRFDAIDSEGRPYHVEYDRGQAHPVHVRPQWSPWSIEERDAWRAMIEQQNREDHLEQISCGMILAPSTVMELLDRVAISKGEVL